jgi:hypothetical protein
MLSQAGALLGDCAAVPVLELSLVSGVIAYTAGIAAARQLGARLASFIGMAEVIFAVLYAWLL